MNKMLFNSNKMLHIKIFFYFSHGPSSNTAGAVYNNVPETDTHLIPFSFYNFSNITYLIPFSFFLTRVPSLTQ